MTESFPLEWPPGFPRTAAANRRRASFGKSERVGDNSWYSKRQLTVAQALTRLLAELARLNPRAVVVSTNVRLRLDGLPYSGEREPEDPGVAVYFHLGGKPHCLPCDRWDRVADNLAAVAKHIEALRGMERWGVGDIARAFAGFQALPPPGGPAPAGVARPWRDVLDVAPTATLADAEARYRELAKQHHPDAGGDAARFSEITEAVRQARQEMSGR